LRQDNADERLMETGYRLGLVAPHACEAVRARTDAIAQHRAWLEGTQFPSVAGNAHFAAVALEAVRHGATLADVLRRPGVRIHHLRGALPMEIPVSLEDRIECAIKYEGYIARQGRDVRAMRDLEGRTIPAGFEFDGIHGISTEAREKLTRIRPETLGQASRIAGVRAADLSILAVHLERQRRAAG
jgi:tRNA uridine 5-carboxymethylaminomethyl modification enzyme